MIDRPFRELPAGDPLPTDTDLLSAIGRLLAWYLEGEKLSQIGLRTLVSIHKLKCDLIGGISFQEIAEQAGYGRSAAHNLSASFEATFPTGRGRLDRSSIARNHYAYARKYGRRAGKARIRPVKSA